MYGSATAHESGWSDLGPLAEVGKPWPEPPTVVACDEDAHL